MQALPRLDQGYHWVCPECPVPNPQQDMKSRQDVEPEAKVEGEGSSRLRELLQASEASPEELPPDLLEDLPDHLIQALDRSRQVEIDAGTKPLREETIQSLRDRGYIITEDSRGPRISGRTYSSRGDTGKLTPSEVVRIAAEMEGGIHPNQKRCEHCDALSPRDSTTCQWCDRPLQL